MAEDYITPKNGSVALPTGHGADFASFEVTESQQTESVAAYGDQVYDPYRGSGTPHLAFTAAAFAKYGASGKSPGLGAMSAGGGAGTLTLDTGVSQAGVLVLSQIRYQHARLRAAVPLTFQGDCGGDMTNTWPVGT